MCIDIVYTCNPTHKAELVCLVLHMCPVKTGSLSTELVSFRCRCCTVFSLRHAVFTRKVAYYFTGSIEHRSAVPNIINNTSPDSASGRSLPRVRGFTLHTGEWVKTIVSFSVESSLVKYQNTKA
jgi:hypothetical protein